MNKKKILQLIILFLIILFFKNFLISKFAVKVPFDDQWESELIKLYVPYEEGTLNFRDFFQSHNEHRIFFTRIFNLSIYILNGNIWDPILVMRIQSILASLVPVLFIFFLYNYKPIPMINLIYLGIICSFPILFENILWGFQNQFYFFQIFSILAFSKVISKMNWKDFFLILVFCIFAYFSMASGALVPVAIGIYIFIESILLKKKNKLIYIPILIFLFLTFYKIIPNLQNNDNFKIKNIEDFIIFCFEFLKLRALMFFDLGYELVWLPLLVVIIVKFKNFIYKYKFESVYLIFLGLVLFSTAYSRGNLLNYTLFTNRYQESFFLIFILLTKIIIFRDKSLNWIKNIYFLLIIICLFFGAKQNIKALNDDKKKFRKKIALENYYLYFSKEKNQTGSGKEFLSEKYEKIDLVYPDRYKLIEFISNPTALKILQKSNLDKP